MDEPKSINETAGWVPSVDGQRAYSAAINDSPKMRRALGEIRSTMASV
jgi:hypothetical protein